MWLKQRGRLHLITVEIILLELLNRMNEVFNQYIVRKFRKQDKDQLLLLLFQQFCIET